MLAESFHGHMRVLCGMSHLFLVDLTCASLNLVPILWCKDDPKPISQFSGYTVHRKSDYNTSVVFFRMLFVYIYSSRVLILTTSLMFSFKGIAHMLNGAYTLFFYSALALKISC